MLLDLHSGHSGLEGLPLLSILTTSGLLQNAAQPLGINGIMVTVPAKVMHDPIAPSIPSFLFQKPKNKSAPKIHSETPKNQLAPRTLKTSYNQKISGPLLM